jgi:hypoxanthine phosphoribosyltransferase
MSEIASHIQDSIRRLPIPEGIEAFWLYDTDTELKAHSAYFQAKAGDSQSALALISDIALAEIYKQANRFGRDCIFVSPFAREASGDNAIPQVLSEVFAVLCEATADKDIIQVTKVYHTGADPMERLALRPEFEGSVQVGGQYVLVDDVTSLGGTLAELANYIQVNGGVVKDVAVIVNAGRNKSLNPDRKTVKILKERFENDIIELFGIQVDALTANEAQYLVGFRSTDEIRNRLLKAKEEVDLRLRSKGIAGIFGPQDS